MKRAAAITIAAIIAFLMWSVGTRHSRPVLVHLPLPIHSVRWDTKYAVFNPFRDRAPERIAQAYLESMNRSNCSDAAKYGRNVGLPNNFTCEQMLKEYHGTAPFLQRFRDRSDNGGDATLWYSDDGYTFNEVTLRRFGNSWEVVEFSKFW
jgi:hypothetical protein